MKQTKSARIFAILIDVVAIGGANAAAARALPSHTIGSYDFLGQEVNVAISFSWLIVPLYFAIFDLLNDGRTAGKIVFGIKTVGEDSSIPPMSTRLLRTAVKCLSLIFWPISLIVFLASEKTMHDAIAKTITLRAKR